MKKLFMFSATAIICLSLTNCTNPQKAGEKLGQEYCDYQKLKTII